MAINFLQDVSLNNTQLTNFKVQNITGTLPSSLTGEGQLIYKSDTNELYLHKGSNTWVSLDQTDGVNTFTSGSGGNSSGSAITSNSSATGNVTANVFAYAGGSNIGYVPSGGANTTFLRGDGTWVVPDNTQGVTTVTTSDGTFINLTPNSATAGAVTVTADLSAGGTPSGTTFLRGDNTWAAVPGGYTSWTLQGDSGTNLTVTNGTTVDIAGSDGISTETNATGIAITNTGVTEISASSPISVNNSTGSVAISYSGGTGSMSTWLLTGDTGGSATIDDGETVTVAGSGVISTARSGNTITISSSAGAGTMSSWVLSDGSNTTSITNGATATFSQGTYMTVGESSGTISIAHNTTSRSDTVNTSSPGSAGTFAVIDSVTTNTTGHITALNTTTVTMPTSPTVYSGWTLAGDSGTNQSITSGQTATFTAGTGITTEAGTATDTLEITNSLPFNSITLASSNGSSSTISNTDTISITEGTAISTTGNGSGGIEIAYTGGTGSMSSWTIAGDSGTTSVGDGNTVTVAGSTGIDTVESGRTVTVNLDLNELTTITSAAATAELIINSSGNKKIDIDDIHLNQFGAAEGNIAMGSNKITGLATGVAGTDAVNVNQLNAAVVGLLEFKGGFNATTGVIDGGATNLTSGGSRVAIAVGDFYVVTTAGDFFGNAAEPLAIGDQVICTTAAAAGSSTQSDFVEVQANIDIATATTVGIANFPTAGGLSITSAGAVSMPTQTSNGTYGAVTKSLTATVDTKGRVTAMGEADIAIPASQITDFCAAVTTCIGTNHNAVADIGNNSATEYDINHLLGTRDVMVQCFSNVTPYGGVELEVQRTDANNIKLKSVNPIDTNAVRVLITEIL